MKNTLYSIFAILFCLLAGKATYYFLGGLPASLYGMLYFALLLNANVFKSDKIRPTITRIIQNMGVCFVPAGVAAIDHLDMIKEQGLIIVTMILITTMLVIASVGLIAQSKLTIQKDAGKSVNEDNLS